MTQDERQREEAAARAPKKRGAGKGAESQADDANSQAAPGDWGARGASDGAESPASAVRASAETTAAGDEPLDESVVAALRAADDKKALELVVLDVREVASFTEYFVIAGGTNARQVQAIADGVQERLKESGRRPARVEGYRNAEWVLLDYGDFVVHVFEEKARRFYDLERLWRDAARVPLPDGIVSTSRSGGDAR
jgi:ribosome-associated protein